MRAKMPGFCPGGFVVEFWAKSSKSGDSVHTFVYIRIHSYGSVNSFELEGVRTRFDGNAARFPGRGACSISHVVLVVNWGVWAKIVRRQKIMKGGDSVHNFGYRETSEGLCTWHVSEESRANCRVLSEN